ncbi:MAG: cytochrome-c peroxidase [Pseudomonadales bacterium]|nr:cytochrome-c peroxidase [Pseudomonadales bacterium]
MMPGRRLGRWALLCCLLAPAAICRELDGAEIRLSEDCPPGYLEREGRCHLVSLYDQYASFTGQGGLRAALPPPARSYTAAQIDLGRYLFFDPLLSRERDMSCANCHRPALGFSDGQARAMGRDPAIPAGEPATGRLLPRNTPGLWNIGFFRLLSWDGKRTDLVAQSLAPVFAADEMNLDAGELARRLRQSAYGALLARAFGKDERYRTLPLVEQAAHALAAFQGSLVSLNSRYDYYVFGANDALSEQELRGLTLFRSFDTRCSECHTPPLFSNQQLATLGVPEPVGKPFDSGAQAVFGREDLRGAFRIPGLRNVALTAPYMHNGVFGQLEDVVKFYADGRGNSASPAEALKIHWHIVHPRLDPQQQGDLVAFLRALTDTSHMPRIPTSLPSGLSISAR